ncbi:MAG TPA: hypothetical protein VHX61_12845 [Rhizomicrobium sp.]|jgi:hypothetical protein|nr:hypothetical protein [Rhizomicrobium sp.]
MVSEATAFFPVRIPARAAWSFADAAFVCFLLQRSLALTRGVLAVVLLINWASIPLVHNAIHLAGETDPGLVGDWRGLYFHKNIAGSVSAMTAILFFFQALKSRPLLNGAFCLGGMGFTVMTVSKSSIGLLPVAP